MISHFIALTFHDKAFTIRELTTFDQLFAFEFINDKCTLISRVQKKFSTSVFRCVHDKDDDLQVFSNLTLLYEIYQKWIEKLNKSLKFSKQLTTYCLRRVTDNAINDMQFENLQILINENARWCQSQRRHSKSYHKS